MNMDISEGDLFSVFGEEWATVNLTEPENRPENDGRVGENDRLVGEYMEGDGVFSPREPPEWREPFENILTAFGSPPHSPQGPPPAHQVSPPAHQVPPPEQREQQTTARIPAPIRRVAVQHCRRLSVYPFLPAWPGQAAANSDRAYGCVPAPPTPARPAPARPAPAQPTPARPAPAQPAPARPTPTRPTPARPVPARPDPARPDPARPAPTRPTPARPVPARPAPARPDPARPAPA